MAEQLNSGSKNPSVIFSKKYPAGVSPVITVPANAGSHQIAVDSIGAATAGTATITILPVGMESDLPLLEADGSTPVVLSMASGDARSDIRGYLTHFTVTTAAFDGAEFKVSIASHF